MADTKVMNCVCKNEYQDKAYQGKRLHNKTMKLNEYRCTVCKKINKTGGDK